MNRVHPIQRLGFQRWYERELLRSHANLVLLLLCTIGLLACAEVYQPGAPWTEQWTVIAGGGASTAIGVVALRRYLYRLNHAEFVAENARQLAEILGPVDEAAQLRQGIEQRAAGRARRPDLA